MMNTNEQEAYLFVGGDLSGIQSFLYNITSKKAAVSLKGRSAYLVKYVASLAQQILNLPPLASAYTEKVHCSGGKFYLIVSDTEPIRRAVEQYAKEEEERLWTEHNGQLGIAIGYVPFVYMDEKKNRVKIGDEQGGVALLWREMSAFFTKKKAQKFRAVVEQHYDDMFEVAHLGGNVQVCAVTGVEDTHCVCLEHDPDEEPIYVLPTVKRQMALGMSIREREHFKTFEEYAENSYLGVLRMDVDGMGVRIQKGFENIAAYRQFSERLSAFFEGDESTLRQLQRTEKYRDNLNIIYAGGDDIFVVGRWDAVLDYAHAIAEQFAVYAHEDGLSISGGMAIVDGKFPIAKAAQMAGEAEAEAKEYVYRDGTKKNAFCFLRECVGWKDEFREVQQLKEDFCHQIQECGLPKGVLHKVMLYASIAQKGKSMHYIWHSAYYFSRLLERCDSRPQAFIKSLRDYHFTKDMRHLRLLALAARWAELVLRTNKNR